MAPHIDQPQPGTVVPPLPAAPPVVPVAGRDALEAARASVHSRFATAAAALAAGAEADFAAIADALLHLSDAEWRALSPHASGAARERLARWHAAQPSLAAAVADLGRDACGDDFQRALLRRRAWQYADAFREALAWRRDHFGQAAAVAVLA
jgi:hypothetical protein